MHLYHKVTNGVILERKNVVYANIFKPLLIVVYSLILRRYIMWIKLKTNNYMAQPLNIAV